MEIISKSYLSLLIIVPRLSDMEIQYFSNMVKDVNLTQVSNEEILSDHAYYFSRKDNKLMVYQPA